MFGFLSIFLIGWAMIGALICVNFPPSFKIGKVFAGFTFACLFFSFLSGLIGIILTEI